MQAVWVLAAPVLRLPCMPRLAAAGARHQTRLAPAHDAGVAARPAPVAPTANAPRSELRVGGAIQAVPYNLMCDLL